MPSAICPHGILAGTQCMECVAERIEYFANKPIKTKTIYRNRRGGKRPGAGAKKKPKHLKKVPCPLTLPNWLMEWLDGQPESRAVLIENALCSFHKLKPPEK